MGGSFFFVDWVVLLDDQNSTAAIPTISPPTVESTVSSSPTLRLSERAEFDEPLDPVACAEPGAPEESVTAPPAKVGTDYQKM